MKFVLPLAFLLLLMASSLRIPLQANDYPETSLPQEESEGDLTAQLKSQSEQRIAADIRFLASDDLQGRGPGTSGLARAAEFIASRWQSLGLDTRIFGEGPYQVFNIAGSQTVADLASNSLRIITSANSGETSNRELVLGQDFQPLSIGGSQTFEGGMCYVGYGITFNEAGLQYDDYASIDVRGKVVVILRKEPQQADPRSLFAGTSASKHAFFASKYANAVAHGASAVLFLNDGVSLLGTRSIANATSGDVDTFADRLPGIEDAGRPNGAPTIPALFVRREVIETLITSQTNMNLYEMELATDQDLKPRSVELTGVQISGSVKLKAEPLEIKNVICRVPGVGALASETIVVGAHYDHVGMGGPGSLAPGVFSVHNGADDNASGTSALLELAQRLAPLMQEISEPRRQIVLIAFTGEERGLLGSRHYVNHPRFPIESTVAMINMDMVGRLSDRQLIVYGTGTGTQFPELVDRANQSLGFRIRKQAEGYGPSDHQPFYERKVPVLHLFTGLHSDYHRPTDDFEKINTDGIAEITDMVYQMTTELAKSPGKPSYVAVPGKADIRLPVARRARLGVRLVQFASDSDLSSSVQIESVGEDSPASKALLKPLDILIAIDQISIESPQSLIDTLSNKNPGDSVMLEIQRGNEKLRIPVQLGQ